MYPFRSEVREYAENLPNSDTAKAMNIVVALLW